MRPPRSERVAPDPHKTDPTETGGVSLALGEVIFILRQRAGYVSQQDLADACRRHLPGWVTMNRRLIQQIEKGDIPPQEVNDVWLLAIAAATNVDPVETFGIDPKSSGDLAPLINLLARHRTIRKAICDSDPSDLALHHSGWNGETAGQSPCGIAVPDDVSALGVEWGWQVSTSDAIGFDATRKAEVLV